MRALDRPVKEEDPTTPFEDVLALLRERSRSAPSTDDPDYLKKTKAIWDVSAAPLPREDLTVDVSGMPAVWVIPEQQKTHHRVLFLHGGGFVFGSPKTHYRFAQHLSNMLGANFLIPDYRLAPEHPFPSAVGDVETAAKYLLKNSPLGQQTINKIAVIGDSAGGNLALTLGLGVLAPSISALGLFSPWVDLSHRASWRTADKQSDPVLTPDRLKIAASAYVPGGTSTDALASPILGDLKNLPRTMIAYGEGELLADDIARFAEAAPINCANLQMREWTEVVHAWHMVGSSLEQGRLAMNEMADFIMQSFKDGDLDGA